MAAALAAGTNGALILATPLTAWQFVFSYSIKPGTHCLQFKTFRLQHVEIVNNPPISKQNWLAILLRSAELTAIPVDVSLSPVLPSSPPVTNYCSANSGPRNWRRPFNKLKTQRRHTYILTVTVRVCLPTYMKSVERVDFLDGVVVNRFYTNIL